MGPRRPQEACQPCQLSGSQIGIATRTTGFGGASGGGVILSGEEMKAVKQEILFFGERTPRRFMTEAINHYIATGDHCTLTAEAAELQKRNINE